MSSAMFLGQTSLQRGERVQLRVQLFLFLLMRLFVFLHIILPFFFFAAAKATTFGDDGVT